MERPSPIELVIGYSFGISPTSAPGLLNERIAQHIAQDSKVTNTSRFVGVQWEIEDALRRIAPNSSRDFVVAPVIFQEEEIKGFLAKKNLDLNQFKNSVLGDETLKNVIASISLHQNPEDIFAFENRTVSYLNRLLHDTTLFREFSSLKLPPLTKNKNGRRWEEIRTIPGPSSPDLGMYQAQRLNRLILESIVPVFPTTKYVGTLDVADAVLANVWRQGLTIAHINIYGHPAHVGRCRLQTLETAWKLGLRLNLSQVDVVPCGKLDLEDPETWDPDNAQEWIRSWDNWQSHEGLSHNDGTAPAGAA